MAELVFTIESFQLSHPKNFNIKILHTTGMRDACSWPESNLAQAELPLPVPFSTLADKDENLKKSDEYSANSLNFKNNPLKAMSAVLVSTRSGGMNQPIRCRDLAIPKT
ncbi:MAG: hypothetical protein WAK26_07485 [Terracidiphilus sp.]